MRFDFRWPGGALTPEQKRGGRASRQRDDSRRLASRHARAAARRSEEDRRDLDGRREVRRHDSRRCRPDRRSSSAAERIRTRPASSGMFLILSESSIGSGIRRIESCVSESAEEFVAQADRPDRDAFVGARRDARRVERTRRPHAARSHATLQTALGQLRARLAAADAQSYVERAERNGDRAFVGAVVREANAEALRHLSAAIRKRLRSGVVALAGVDDGTVEPARERERRSGEGGRARREPREARGSARRGQGRRTGRAGAGRRQDAGGAEAAVRAIRDAVLA